MSCKTKTIVSVLVLFAAAPAAFGALAAFGPVQANGFPLWVQDPAGVSLQIGTDPLLTSPPAAGESFYFLAQAVGDIPAGGALAVPGRLTYVAAVEATFLNPALPTPGTEIVFGRIRIRCDVPAAGTYTVTHPYGVNTFTVAAGGIRAINFTSDIIGAPPTFAAALATPVGPFLKAAVPAPPAGFIGNFAILQTVTGSPRGTNFVRIVGPGVNLTVTDFSLSGQIFAVVPPAVPPGAPLTGSAAIARTPFVDIATTSAANATVVASLPATPAAGLGKPAGAAQRVAMVGDGAGNFFVRLYTPSFRNLPANVTVESTVPGGAPTAGTIPLTDSVQILSATYNVLAKTLVCVAISSDRSKLPTLTATGFGAFTGTVLIRRAVASPPAEITVTSAGGGTATAPVNIVGFVKPTAAP